MAQRTGIELSDPAAYRKKLVDLLNGRDPVKVMGRTGDELRAIVNDTPREKMCHGPHEGKWTPTEIIGHLHDAEWAFGNRLRAVLCEDRPQIIGIDQEAWVDGQRHNECDPKELVEMFAGLRSVNLRLWRNLGPDDLQRVGLHNERGEESLETMRLMVAGHDLSHLDQIRRYLQAS